MTLKTKRARLIADGAVLATAASLLGSGAAPILGAAAAAAVPLAKARAVAAAERARPDEAVPAGRTGETICRLNPFDSTRRPCGGGLEPEPDPPPSGGGERCTGAGRLLGTVVATEPAFGLAVIEVEGRGEPFVVGDEVPGLGRLGAVGWRLARVDAASGPCLLDLYGEAATPPPGGEPGARPERRPSAPGRGLHPELRAALDDGLRVLTPTERALDRRAVDAILSRAHDLAGEARISPRDDGLGLVRLRPGGLLEALGLRSGDVLQRVGPVEVRSVDGLVRAYAELRDSTDLTVTLLRDGRPVTLSYAIR